MTDAIRQQAVDLDEVIGGEPAAAAVGLDAIDEQLLAQLAGRARAAQRTTTPMPAPWIMRSLRS